MVSSVSVNPLKGGLDKVIASKPHLWAADLSAVISLSSKLVTGNSPEVYEAQQPKANNLKLVVGGVA